MPPAADTAVDDACGQRPARDVSFAEALRFWLKLGWISFGGPAGQIAIMHRELVERRRWLSEERFLHALNYCMMLPGPEAQQLAVYIGWLMHRTWGGIVAGTLFVAPSVLILLTLSYVYAAYGGLPWMAGVLDGFKPVVVAVVVEAVVRIGRRALKSAARVLIAALSFVAIYFLSVPFPLIVLGAAALGLLAPRLTRRRVAPADGQKPDGRKDVAETSDEGAALPLVIEDSARPRPHTRPSRRRELKTLLLGLALWLAPLALLRAWRGPESLHAQVYLFFTKAALVTFGGAYAVLAYVTQAVTTPPLDWLTPEQAVDGLALAETTPGPLIMVLQHVGFLAGWNRHPADLSPAASAVASALATTYATFLPCFLFIFIGAPYIEVLRGNRRLDDALGGVTSSVVGVILNLAVVFGLTVVWPRGALAPPDLFALAVCACAFFALQRLRTDVLWVVLGGGLCGLVRALLTGRAG